MSERTQTAVVHIEVQNANKDLFRTAQSRLEEAIELAKAIDLDVQFEKIFNIKRTDPAILMGKGQAEILAKAIEDFDLKLIIVNHSLSPIQQRNLERLLKIKVIDRTALILEIFGERAATREGRLQVDAAALKFQKSRLVRSWTHLERQRGGRGFLGGPGETQIEADRRALDTQIQAIEARLENIKRTRGLHRQNRKRNDIPVIALVGYTNAGKSTLFNRLSRENVMAKDMLFATLDPVMRKVKLPSGRDIILSDTVGFISDLPTELVAAFRATLEEVQYADIILHVRDASSPEQASQAKDVWKILRELGVNEDSQHPKIIDVLNKIDQIEAGSWLHDQYDAIKISALTGQNIDQLFAKLDEVLADNLFQNQIKIGYENGLARAWAYENNIVQSEENTEEGITLKVDWNDELKQKFLMQFGSKAQII